MPMDSNETNPPLDGLYDEIRDGDKCEKLVEKVLHINKPKPVRKTTRTEPCGQISEFTLSTQKSNKTATITSLSRSIRFGRSKLKRTRRIPTHLVDKIQEGVQKTLPRPLEKPQADQIRRGIGYERARLQLDDWDATVASNRTVPTIYFPLAEPENLQIKDNTSADIVPRFRIKTPFQLAIEELNGIPMHNESQTDNETVQFPLSMSELMERRKEVARLRVFQSRQEAKARRERRIKSKKFHRIQKKERVKQSLKEFELLSKTNPEAALEKLQEMDKVRAQERFSLRHRSTGHWAKNKQVRAKYNKESREALAEQLSLGRQMTQKVQQKTIEEPSDDDEEIEKNEDERATTTDEPLFPKIIQDNNPWMEGMRPDKEVVDVMVNYRKFWLEKSGNSEKINGNKCSDKTTKNTTSDKTEIEPSSGDSNSKVKRKCTNEDENRIGLQSKNKKSKRLIKVDVTNGALEQPSNDQNSKVKRIKTVSKKSAKGTNPNCSSNKGKSSKEEKIPTKLQTKKKQSRKVKKSNDTNQPIPTIEEIFNKYDKQLEKKGKEQLRKQITLDKTTKKKGLKQQQRQKFDLSLVKQSKKIILNEELIETDQQVTSSSKETSTAITNVTVTGDRVMDDTPQINPMSFLKLDSVSDANLIENHDDDDDDLEEGEGEGQTSLIREAFAGDGDVVGDFKKEKMAERKANQIKPFDANQIELPGWGSWTTSNTMMTQEQLRQKGRKTPSAFRMQRTSKPLQQQQQRRRDDKKPSVIINECGNLAAIRSHQVADVPFPFRAVSDFEASMRAPIGNTFVSEKSFRRLTQPAVITQMGTVIEPISRDILVRQK